MKPAFLITIDTEGDNAWARPRTETTRNAAFLPRFQQLAERCGFRPVWLTTWEMAQCPVFREFARDALRRDTAEIGMHLHAWSSPPLTPLSHDDRHWQPFLIDYPEAVMREKINVLTETLRSVFETEMVSHRAGRWAFDGRYARLLCEQGYRADCSVTPGVSWRGIRGAPGGCGGPDYRPFPAHAYRMSLTDIATSGDSALLEVPMTTKLARHGPVTRAMHRAARALGSLPARVASRLAPPVRWLRPDGRNALDLIRLVDEIADAGEPYAEWMLHSSEFMPGGSPRFPDERSVERLFADTETLFRHAATRFRGCTLAEFEREPSAGPGKQSPSTF